MQAVVIYVSRSGNTKRIAELIGGALHNGGADVAVRPYDGIDYHELAAADLVVAGTWVDGLFLFGQRPGDGRRLGKIPELAGKNVAVFCTYAFNPGKTIDKLANRFANAGANIVAAESFKRDSTDVSSFAEAALAPFSAAARAAEPSVGRS